MHFHIRVENEDTGKVFTLCIDRLTSTCRILGFSDLAELRNLEDIAAGLGSQFISAIATPQQVKEFESVGYKAEPKLTVMTKGLKT